MLIGRARSLIDQGQLRAALPILDEAVAKDPKSANAFAWRGRTKNQLGQFRDALSDLDQAISLDPKNILALVNRGYIRFVLKDSGGGLADLNLATEIDPTSPGSYANRSLIYAEMGEQQRAIEEANKSIQIAPKYGPGYASLGNARIKLQQYDQAIEAFDNALKFSPGVGGYLNGRAAAYLSLGETDRAFADLNAALAINPRNSRALINRGRVLIEKGDHAAAIKDLSSVLVTEPRNVFALLPRARAYELSGNLAAAKADYQTVLGIIPSHGVATAGLERIETKLAAASGTPRPATNRAGVRVALVIGNSNYTGIDPLANPERDAKLLADTLRRSGFEKVELVVDGTREKLLAALKTFADDAANADWAVVYYAGHGIELDGSNYLVPVDVKYRNDDDIPRESLALDQVLNSVSGASKLRLVILDACRENPYVAELSKQEQAPGRGLARIEPESGTLVAFATKHGHLAADGTGDNSPFAAALSRRIETPGLEINQLFRLVHDDVYASTAKKQEPFTYGQLSSQGFYFKSR